MRRYILTMTVGLGLVAATVYLISTRTVAAQTQLSAAVFDSDGKLPLPTGFRKWVFVGAPLTPNGLNNGKAGFPEYHHVYIEAKNVDVYLKTGSFPEGTVIVKELTRVLSPTFPDGSRTEPSGRGFFNGEYNGIDLTVKNNRQRDVCTSIRADINGYNLKCRAIERPPSALFSRANVLGVS
jgi:hypothetical protein